MSYRFPIMFEKRVHKPWVTVIVGEDYDLTCADFDTYEEALAHVKEDSRKACIVGPEWVEDHT